MKFIIIVSLFFCIIAGLIFYGCTKENTTTIEPESQISPQMHQPKGTISGKIIDKCTNAAINGAFISVGFDGAVHNVTSDASGSFSFANVPVGRFIDPTCNCIVNSGTYTLTVSLVDYNKSKTDPTKRYRDYYYTTVTITFTSLVPGDSLGVHGMVGSTVITISNLNTTIAGDVVDVDHKPVENALVTLFDLNVFPPVVLQQTITSSAGVYRFTGIDNGLTIMIKAQGSNGTTEGQVSSFSLNCNQTYDSLRSQVNIERIMLLPVDNVAPYIISITPQNDADISPTGVQVVYTFSEPIKQTTYTRTDLPLGHGTIMDDIKFYYDGLKKASGLIPFTASWNTSYTQFTIVPQGIIGSAKYRVNVLAAFTAANIQDRTNNGLVPNPNAKLIGDFELLYFTTNGSSTVPAAPVLVRRIIPTVYSDLDYYGGTVGLEWNYDANARSYNIYRSVNSGTYDLLVSDYYGLQYETMSPDLVTPAVTPSSRNPLSAISVKYLVRAVSRDLVEGTSSNIITVQDGVKPRLLAASVAAAPPPAPANTWLYTMRFSEPLTLSNAENIANYGFSNTGAVVFTINRADYLGYDTPPAGYYIQLQVTTSAALPVGYILTAQTGIIDLTGNTIDPTANSRTF